MISDPEAVEPLTLSAEEQQALRASLKSSKRKKASPKGSEVDDSKPKPKKASTKGCEDDDSKPKPKKASPKGPGAKKASPKGSAVDDSKPAKKASPKGSEADDSPKPKAFKAKVLKRPAARLATSLESVGAAVAGGADDPGANEPQAAVEGPPSGPLGCSRCRYGRTGCSQCRKPSYRPRGRRSQRDSEN